MGSNPRGKYHICLGVVTSHPVCPLPLSSWLMYLLPSFLCILLCSCAVWPCTFLTSEPSWARCPSSCPNSALSVGPGGHSSAKTGGTGVSPLTFVPYAPSAPRCISSVCLPQLPCRIKDRLAFFFWNAILIFFFFKLGTVRSVQFCCEKQAPVPALVPVMYQCMSLTLFGCPTLSTGGRSTQRA